MEKINDKALEILDISEKIFHIQEHDNSAAIFKDKTFIIGCDSDCNSIFTQKKNVIDDSIYYFETPEIDGLILERKNGNYCVKASVRYTDIDNFDALFAKIRIEVVNGSLKVMGTRWGSLKQLDCEDYNLLDNPTNDFIIALVTMKNYLIDIYKQLSEKIESSDNFDPVWVKKIKKFKI